MTCFLRLLILARVSCGSVSIDYNEVYDNTFEPHAATGQLMQEVLDVVGGTASWAYIIAAPSPFDITGNADLIESYDGAFSPNDGLANYLQNVVDFIASAIAWSVIINTGPGFQGGGRNFWISEDYFDSENYDYIASDDRENDEAEERGLVKRSTSFDFSEVVNAAFSTENCIANWIQNAVNFFASSIAWLILIYMDLPSLLNVSARKKRDVDQSGDLSDVSKEKVEWIFNKLAQSVEDYNSRFAE